MKHKALPKKATVIGLQTEHAGGGEQTGEVRGKSWSTGTLGFSTHRTWFGLSERVKSEDSDLY